MNSQPCNRYEEVISLVASGLATNQQEEELRRHLESCESCRSELGQSKLLSAMLEGAISSFAPPAPPGLHARFMERLRAEVPSPTKARTIRSHREPSPNWKWFFARVWKISAVGAGCACAVLAWGWFHARYGSPAQKNLNAFHVRPSRQAQALRTTPARPAEMRRALVRSFDELEQVLRHNDELLAAREPVATTLGVPERK